MVGRRLLILLAVMVALTILAGGVAPRRPPATTGNPEATRSPRLDDGAVPPRTLERRLDADKGGPPRRVVARSGQMLVLTVKSSEVDQVSIDGLSEVEPVDPDSPARFDLFADEPGSYPIELGESGRRIGTLRVRPGG